MWKKSYGMKEGFLIGGGLIIVGMMCWWGINYLPAAQGSSVHVYNMSSN